MKMLIATLLLSLSSMALASSEYDVSIATTVNGMPLFAPVHCQIWQSKSKGVNKVMVEDKRHSFVAPLPSGFYVIYCNTPSRDGEVYFTVNGNGRYLDVPMEIKR